MSMQFIDLKTQRARIEDNVMAGIHKVLEHGAFVMGPEVSALETELASFAGVKHAIGVSSGTDALLIALMAAGVGAGDEVITSPFSFFATAEVIALLGAIPVFVDIDRNTYNIDASLIEAAITPKTKAIMPVSMYGQCADFDKINEIAARHALPVIEDGAQSFGATYKGQHSGNLSTIGCTSFFPSKPLGCYGDGGACFTNDDELAALMRSIRVHGQAERYQHARLGVNGRLDTIQAAILLEKMAIFPDEIEKRQAVAARYKQGLSSVVTTPQVASHNTSVFAQYTVEVPNREQVQAELKALGIPTAVHYPKTLHKQPALVGLCDNDAAYPHAEAASLCVMSLPMHPYLSETDQDKVIAGVQSVVEQVSELA